MDSEQNIPTNEAFVRSLQLEPIKVSDNLLQNSITNTRNRIADTINNTNTQTFLAENSDRALQSSAIPNRLVDRNTNANEIADSTRTPAQRASFVEQYRKIRVSNVSQNTNGDMVFTSVIPPSFITKNPTTGVIQLNGNLTTVANTSNVSNYNLRNTSITELPDGTYNLSQTFSPKKSDTSFRQRYYLQSDFGSNYSNRGLGVMLSLNISGGRTSINLGPVYNQFSGGVNLTRDNTNTLPVPSPLTAIDIDQSIKLKNIQTTTVVSNINTTTQSNKTNNSSNIRPMGSIIK